MNMAVFLPAAVSLFVRSLPAHLMAYWPFRNRLRFPLWTVLLPVALIQLGQSLFYGYTAMTGGNGLAVSYGFAPVYMAIYFFSVRDDRFKVLFLYLLVTDYVMILRGASTFLEARFFARPGMNLDSWVSVALNLVVLAVSAPFMLRLFSNAREKVFGVDAPVFWRTAWVVPACTTAIVMIFTAGMAVRDAGSFEFLFARALLLLCVFVVCSTLLDSLDGIRRQAALAEQAEVQEQLLKLQRSQHEQLLQYNEEVKAARHDLRQHLSVIWGYLNEGNLDGLKDYLRSYEKELPPDIRRIFTKNFALNVVCTHYAEEARKYGISYDVELDMPERLPAREPEICALLGNLLENAVDACREVRESTPFIRVRGLWEDGHIVFAVDNSSEREPKWKDGRLLSSKREGFGTGTWTIRRAAERSGGMAKFTYEDGVFYASVFLYD